jgi:hypothetical protein
MTLHPEQERALAWARRRGTESSLAEIRGRVASTYAELEAVVDAFDPALSALRPQPSSWCAREVVDHLVVSDGPAVAQLASLLAGRDVGEPIPASLQSPGARDASWDELARRLRRVHGEMLATLDTASDGTPLLAKAVVEMVVKCAGPDGALRPVHWLERFDWKAFAVLLAAHNREHVAQLRRIEAALATAVSAPRPGSRQP